MLRSRTLSFVLLLALFSTFLPRSSQQWSPLAARAADAQDKPAGRGDIPAERGSLRFAPAIDLDGDAASNPTASASVPVVRHSVPGAVADHPLHYAEIRLGAEVVPEHGWQNPAGIEVSFRLWNTETGLDLSETAAADAWGAVAAGFTLNYDQLEGQFAYQASSAAFGATPVRTFRIDPATASEETIYGEARLRSRLEPDGKLVIDISSERVIDDSPLAAQVSLVRLVPQAGTAAPALEDLPTLIAERIDDHHARASIYLDGGSYALLAEVTSGSVEAHSLAELAEVPHRQAPPMISVDDIAPLDETHALVSYRTTGNHAAMRRLALADLPPNLPQTFSANIAHSRTRVGAFQWQDTTYSIEPANPAADTGQLALGGLRYDPVLRRYDFSIVTLDGARREQPLAVEVLGPNGVVIYEESTPVVMQPGTPLEHGVTVPADLGEPYGLRVLLPGLDQSASLRPDAANGGPAGSAGAPQGDDDDAGWFITKLKELAETSFLSLVGGFMFLKEYGSLKVNFELAFKFLEVNLATIGVECTLLTGECKVSGPKGLFFDPSVTNRTQIVFDGLQDYWLKNFSTLDFNAFVETGLEIGSLEGVMKLDANLEIPMFKPGKCPDPEAEARAKAYVKALGENLRDLAIAINVKAKNILEAAESAINKLAIPLVAGVPVQVRMRAILSFQVEGGSDGEYSITLDAFLQMGLKAALVLNLSVMDLLKYLLLIVDMVDLGVKIYSIISLYEMISQMIDIYKSASQFTGDKQCNPPPPPERLPDDRRDAPQGPVDPYPTGLSGSLYFAQQQIAGADRLNLARAAAYWRLEARRLEMADHINDTAARTAQVAETQGDYEAARFQIQGLLSGTIPLEAGQTITQAVHLAYGQFEYNLSHTDYEIKARSLQAALDFAQRDYDLLRGQELELQHELRLLDQRGSVGVLDSGLAGRTMLSLGAFGLTATPIKLMPGVSNTGVIGARVHTPYSAPPVLIIPSGGLYGYTESAQAKAWLEAYVASGGTLIALAQADGVDWEVLPGGQVRGLGYSEDIFCNQASVRVVNDSPWLAGINRDLPDIQIDGSFTAWPAEASVILLRTTGNQMPAMIEYPYGNGQVIATAAYPDFVMNGLQSPEDVVFASSLFSVAFLRATGQTLAASASPGQPLSLPTTVRNTTAGSASLLTVWNNYYDYQAINSWRWARALPAALVMSRTLALQPALQSGEARTVNLAFAAPDSAGIFRANYFLGDAGEWSRSQAIPGPLYRVERSGPPLQPLSLSLARDRDEYAYGSTATLTATLRNNGAAIRTLALVPGAGLPGQPLTVTLAPGETFSQAYQTPVTASGAARLEVREAGTVVNRQVVPLRLRAPILGLDVSPERMISGLATTARLTATLSDDRATSVTWEVRRNGDLLESFSSATQVDGAFHTARASVELPAAAAGDRFTVRLALPQTGEAMTQTIAVGEPATVAGARVIAPLTMGQPNPAAVRVRIQDQGRPGAAQVQALVEQSGQVVAAGPPSAVELGDRAHELLIDLPVPATLDFYGSYTIAVSMTGQISGTDRTFSTSRSIDFPAMEPRTTLETITFSAGDPLVIGVGEVPGSVMLPASGPYTLTLTPYAGGFSTPVVVPATSVISGQRVLAAAMPSLPSGGNYFLTIETASLTGWYSQHRLFVRPQSFSYAVDPSAGAGDSLGWRATNTGGVDSRLEGTLALIDAQDQIVGSAAISLSAPIGAERAATLAVPEQIGDGAYTLRWTGRDHEGGALFGEWPVAISGGFGLSADTDQPRYRLGDIVRASGLITAGAALGDAWLRLEVIEQREQAPAMVSTLAGNTWVSDGVGPAAAVLGIDIAWSHDGAFALFVESGAIRRLDLASWAVTTLVEDRFAPAGSPLDRMNSIDLSSDDSFAVIGAKDCLLRFDLGSGELSVVAGACGVEGNSSPSDDGIGASARFWGELSVDLSADDSFVLVRESEGYLLRRVTLGDRRVTTVGEIPGGFHYMFGMPSLALSSDDSFAVLTNGASQVIRFDLASRTFSPLAGTTQRGSADGPGSQARFQAVSGVAILPDNSGALLLDETNMTIRHLALSAPYTVTTQYGGLGERQHRDGIGLASRFTNFPLNNGIAIDATGTAALLAEIDTIRRIDLAERRVSTVAGAPTGADGVGAGARFTEPQAIALSRDGAFALVADTANHTLRRIDIASGAVSTVAGQLGQPGATDGISGTGRLQRPVGVAISPDNSFALVADDGISGDYNYAIRRVELASGAISTLAGSPTPGSADGPGASARFDCLQELAISPTGAFALIADECNHTIRRLELTSPYTVTTIAGLAQVYGTADGPGADARFLYPQGVAISPDATFALVADFNNTIRRVELAPPYAVSTVAGFAGQEGFVDASGSLARFADPASISFAGATLALIADRDNNTVRQLDLASGAVSTLAGRPLSGRVDGPASSARFRSPSSLASSADGSFALVLEESYTYLAGQNDVRRLDLGSRPQVLDTRWVPVSGAGSLGYTLPLTAPDLLAHPAARGQLRLQATLFGDEPAAAPREDRRLLATAAALFTVAEPGQSLEIYPEQPAYRVNLPGTALDDAAAAVRLSGTAWNDGPVAGDLSLTVTSSDGRQVHAQSWPAVPPGAARSFSLVDAAPPAGQISYTATLTPAASASATVAIRPGLIEASSAITPTAVVSGQAALQRVRLTNQGGVPGYVRAAFGGGEREVLIPPGATITLSGAVTPTGHGAVTLPVSLTGDLERTLQPAAQVEDQSVTLLDLDLGDTEIDEGSLAQPADANFYLFLRSTRGSSFDAQLSYTLSGPTARSGGTITQILPIGSWEPIALGRLETGTYTLSISLSNPRLGIELARLERALTVVPVRRALELTASATPPDGSGLISLTVGLTNTLASNTPAYGRLILTGLTEQEQWVGLQPGQALSDIINSGEGSPVPFEPINVAGLSGVQEVGIEYQSEDGTIMASYRLAIELQPRLAPLVELVALEAAPASAGGTAALSITLDNRGAAGEAPLTITAFDQSFSLLAAAAGGQTSSVAYAVPVPATLLAGTYPVVAQLGDREVRADVTVAGPEITLRLATNQDQYAPRSAVAWTATVESNGPPADYDVVLRYGGAEYTRTVTLQSGAPVTVPWIFTAGAVSDYATAIVRSHAGPAGGQALAIDTSMITVIEDPAAWLESDSARYEAGEVVSLTLHLDAPGRLAAVFAPNDLDGPLGLQLWSSVPLSGGEPISGAYTLAYTLPATLATGRYAFRYSVDGEERSLPVDLFGVALAAEPLEIELGGDSTPARARAQAGIPITVSTRLRSDRQVDAVVRAYALDGSGGYHSLGAAATLTTTLEAGATPLSLSGVLLPQGTEAYQIVVNVYAVDGGRPLGGGSAYVDVGAALLTGLSTDHGVYGSGQAGVGTVAVYGSETATVAVRTSAGAVLLNRTLPLTGYAALTFSLPTATPRDEVLTATVTDSRGLISTRQVAYRVADAFDTTAPRLAALTPADGARLIAGGSGAVVTVSGVVTETNGVAVLVNGAPASVNNGRWSIDLPLSLGPNMLDLTAVDQAGNVGVGDPHLITLEPGYGVSLSATPLSAQPGATITFQAVVTSSAPLTATVIFPFSLAAVEPQAGSASSGVLTVTDRVVWRGRVAPGAPVTIQWTGRALQPGEYRLQAAVQAGGLSLHRSREQTLTIGAAPTQRKLYLPLLRR